MTKPMKTQHLASGQHGKPPVVEECKPEVPPPIKMAIKLTMPPDSVNKAKSAPTSRPAPTQPKP